MDFAAIGEAMAMGQAIKNANKNAQEWIDWSSRQVAIAKARAEAQDAGRRGQIRILLEALRSVDPGNPALDTTGLFHDDGTPEIRWQRGYDRPYDEIAIKNQIPPCSKAVHPAEAARLAVMRESVTSKRVLFVKTWWFRGEQHRSERGALAARKAAADAAARQD
jgi:hypothetical protein